MKRFHFNGSDTLVVRDVFDPQRLARFFTPRFVRGPSPPAKQVARAQAASSAQACIETATEEPYCLWKDSLAETERPTPLLLIVCYAVFGASVAAAIGYALYSLYGLFHADALDRAVRIFLG